MRVRVWRDAGAFVAPAALGTGVAFYTAPPLTSGGAVTTLAWFILLAVGVRHLAGRAKGRGVVGTPERNAEYYADPEHFALGGTHSFSIGAGLGMAAMLAALAAKAF